MSYNISNNSNSNYPTMSQSEWDKLNECENPDIEVDVTVSMTLSKTVKIKVKDYKKDGEDIDFSECDLKNAVKEQIYLPNEASNLLLSGISHKILYRDLSNWDIDDFEVILE